MIKLNAAKGVAPESPSTTGSANGNVSVEAEIEVNLSATNAGCQVVIATGNAACKTARPTSAGLKTLYPRPPKINLPMAMPMTPPQNTIHSGKVGGNVNPNNNPLMAADQSDTVDSFLENLHK